MISDGWHRMHPRCPALEANGEPDDIGFWTEPFLRPGPGFTTGAVSLRRRRHGRRDAPDRSALRPAPLITSVPPHPGAVAPARRSSGRGWHGRCRLS